LPVFGTNAADFAVTVGAVGAVRGVAHGAGARGAAYRA
jgi:hypothetical protein